MDVAELLEALGKQMRNSRVIVLTPGYDLFTIKEVEGDGSDVVIYDPKLNTRYIHPCPVRTRLR